MSEEFNKILHPFSNNIFTTCVGENDNKNVLLSPLSIQTALSLMLMGAKGKTADEIMTTFKCEHTTREEIAKHFETFMNSTDSDVIKIANKIYVQNGQKIKDGFNEIARNKFSSETQNINFVENVKSAQEINKWIDENTFNKIKNLIQATELNNQIKIILVNAIHFKGTWRKKFKTESTDIGKFWTSASESVDVQMMHMKYFLNYVEFKDVDAKVLELSYKESDISMVIILPNQRDGLKKLESELSDVDYTTIYDEMDDHQVDVTLPKFKIEFNVKLNETLKKMGIATIFTDNADLTDLHESKDKLKVSEFIHKTYIDIDEEGSLTSAATRTEVTAGCSLDKEPIFFIVDHPFIFLLKDSENVTYFSGHVYNINS